MRYAIDADIRRAETLPAAFYRDREVFEATRDRLFPESWHLVGDVGPVSVPGSVLPFVLHEGFVDEPLLLARDAEDELRCLSNVCTHRGNLLVEHGGHPKNLRCRYHGRRFDLDGSFRSMPECEHALGFPRPEDDLPRVPLESWGRLLFVSLEPSVPFADWIAPVRERLDWFPMEDLRFDPVRSRDYLVEAHWALYCENYLEGFHIPYVHPSLAGVLDYGSYRTELFEWANLQVGIAADDEDAFELPESAPDHGQRVAAYYWFLFPGLMLNFYPWGLSANVIRPLGPRRTRISYLTWVARPERLDRGAGAGLDRVEREDEAIVEMVQRGMSSRLYHRGRYSPTREEGVHHFQSLLARTLG